MGEDSLMVNGSLKRSLEISNILIHPEYKPNAPTYSFPSDFDVGKTKKACQTSLMFLLVLTYCMTCQREGNAG